MHELYYTYILYSKTLNKFYIGATNLHPNERLSNHLEQYYGSSKFTAKVKDWILYFKIECTSYSQAIKVERHIKKMKSKIYIKNLVKYPEISEKLLKQYNSS